MNTDVKGLEKVPLALLVYFKALHKVSKPDATPFIVNKYRISYSFL
ncbi:hypothetical protein Q5C_05300 [Leuconostoc pseudomesenteroides 4882]|nr:hypothetical protein Q5C_05300 [Leuconostoc pseudomesenteroides 4882]